MDQATKDLKKIFDEAHALNLKDSQLAAKYENDSKYAKIHKRIKEKNLDVLVHSYELQEFLITLKHETDEKVVNNHDILKNEEYFQEATKSTIMEILEKFNIRNLDVVRFINGILVNEYFQEMAV